MLSVISEDGRCVTILRLIFYAYDGAAQQEGAVSDKVPIRMSERSHNASIHHHLAFATIFPIPCSLCC
ncbi:hypothetical protein IQ267_26195 [filamentous cyanobacterium LEGE 07170]|nr:hypothetical protein [filamentous cyanobacterium LEGE 07170]